MTIFNCLPVLLMGAFATLPALAGVGSVDSRENVNWADYPQIVHLMMHLDADGYYSECTGQYVAPNLILTAAHCIKDDAGNVMPGDNFAVNYKKERFPITLLWVPAEWKIPGSTGAIENAYDYAVFRVEDERYYAVDNKYYGIQDTKNSSVNIYNAGFGWVTKLYDNEIPKLKADFEAYIASITPDEKGVKNYSAKTMQERFENILGRSLRDSFDDHKLKVDSTCSASKTLKRVLIADNTLLSDCDSWSGNSGGAAVNRSNGKLIGVLSSGEKTEVSYDFDDASHFVQLVAVSAFNNKLQQLISKYAPKATKTDAKEVKDEATKTDAKDVKDKTKNDGSKKKEETDKTDGMDPVESVKTVIGKVGVSDGKQGEKDLDNKKKKQEGILKKAVDKKKLTDKEFLRGIVEPVVEINRIEELQKAYQKAKENEKSFGNRMLGGLTMAATGIGGMELAMGLAEKKADEAAAADMQAYMATFQCRIGEKGGKSYPFGTKNIETPGANQLVDLYSQYVSLADSLKQRKSDLNMRPGIESEVIIDKSTTGLYDDVGNGIQNGTYASLYRAAKGSEADQTKLDEQKSTYEKRIKGGAIAAGVGIVGGIAGNVLLNHIGKDVDDGVVIGKTGLNDAISDECTKIGATKVNGTCVCNDTTKVYKDGDCVSESIESDPEQPDGDDTPTGNNEEATKLKECLDYINSDGLFGFTEVGGCVRLAVKVANSSDVLYVLNNDEAKSLSPVWDWGCVQWSDDERMSLYGSGSRVYADIPETERDACETVEKLKAFIAEHNKPCSEYDNRQEWVDPVDNAKFCVQKDWVEAEKPAEDKKVNEKKHHTKCSDEDFKSSEHTKNAAEGWYFQGKCVAKSCVDGYEIAKNAKGESQGYCKKISGKK